jgi:hypothetical protein
VVIREQRIASDSTLSRACLSDLRASLLRRPDLNPETLVAPLPSTAGRVMWDMLLGDLNWSGPATAPLNEGLWVDPGTAMSLATGDMTWTDDAYTPQREWAIRLNDRLWPSESSQVQQALPNGSDPYRPLFVWDFVARRAEFGDLYARNPLLSSQERDKYIGKPDVIQIVVFVRRIDQNIRMPRVVGATLRDVLLAASRSAQGLLTNIVNVTDERLPVAVDTTGLPTNNGVGDYSLPILVRANFDPTVVARNRIRMDTSDPVLTTQVESLAKQPGQRIIDNLGNVYTVKASDEADPNTPVQPYEVVVDPPIPFAVAGPASGSPNTIRQIVFTPQIPVAVEILTFKRPVAN